MTNHDTSETSQGFPSFPARLARRELSFPCPGEETAAACLRGDSWQAGGGVLPQFPQSPARTHTRMLKNADPDSARVHVSLNVGQDTFMTNTRKAGRKEGSGQTTGFAGLGRATGPALLVEGRHSGQFLFSDPSHASHKLLSRALFSPKEP